MAIHTVILNDKYIAYSDETPFLVQVGRKRGAYRTRYEFIGNIKQALIYYNALNIGCFYKKRLYAPTMNKKVLARRFS